jgi:hypothetical protein
MLMDPDYTIVLGGRAGFTLQVRFAKAHTGFPLQSLPQRLLHSYIFTQCLKKVQSIQKSMSR